MAKKATKKAHKKPAKKAHKAAKKHTKRKPNLNSPFFKKLTPSAELAEIVGTDPLPRTAATKKVWDYIKHHKLKDTKEKRNINPDEKLSKVVGSKQISMFELPKHMAKHLS
jgi:chromatin remodeling complex protein RSC6